MASNTRIQVRLGEDLYNWLTGRADRAYQPSRHEHARTELGMWRDVLAAELRRIRLTLPQARTVAEIIGGTMLNLGVPTSLGLVYAEVYDAFRLAEEAPVPTDYGEQHGLDQAAQKELLDYLGRLGPAADLALADAISRWWATGAEPTVDGFASVGLTVIAPS